MTQPRQTYKLELDDEGVAYARIYVEGRRTSAFTYVIPDELVKQAKRISKEPMF